MPEAINLNAYPMESLLKMFTFKVNDKITHVWNKFNRCTVKATRIDYARNELQYVLENANGAIFVHDRANVDILYEKDPAIIKYPFIWRTLNV